MRRALTHVEWIEQSSIEANGKKLTVSFKINDKKAFNLDAIKEALPGKYKQGVEVVSGP